MNTREAYRLGHEWGALEARSEQACDWERDAEERIQMRIALNDLPASLRPSFWRGHDAGHDTEWARLEQERERTP